MLEEASPTFALEKMGPFADLPAEVLDLILQHLDRVGEHPQLFTVACAAQTLASLSQVQYKWQCAHMCSVFQGCLAYKSRYPCLPSQVCRGTKVLAQRRLLSMSSTSAYETASCPVTCFPYVWGMHERYAYESRWLCLEKFSLCFALCFRAQSEGRPRLCASSL